MQKGRRNPASDGPVQLRSREYPCRPVRRETLPRCHLFAATTDDDPITRPCTYAREEQPLFLEPYPCRQERVRDIFAPIWRILRERLARIVEHIVEVELPVARGQRLQIEEQDACQLLWFEREHFVDIGNQGVKTRHAPKVYSTPVSFTPLGSRH